MAKSGVSKHLPVCPQRRGILAKAEQKAIPSESLYHLRVQDAYSSDFWLDLEARGSARLKDLDDYLRAIWLECCGHLSQFSIGGWGGSEIAMKRRLEEVFAPGVTLTHIYDFGTSSETLIKLVAIRQGKPSTSRAMTLMARNLLPQTKCMECEEQAAWLCEECMYEDDAPGTLCDKHAKTHPHDNYGEPVAIVNSPRVGMCGYEGPADPPY
jgi:hypothetical protein